MKARCACCPSGSEIDLHIVTSDELTEVLADIYDAARRANRMQEGDAKDVQFVAAHFVLIDSQFAIESYTTMNEFADYKQAYLAKFGLLQALQNQLKAVEELATAIGEHVRMDRLPGVASVLVTRHIVAGHPLGGKVDGTKWQHFHDRGTVHDPAVIRVMSFEVTDPKNWTGQTILVAELLRDESAAVLTALTRLRAFLPE